MTDEQAHKILHPSTSKEAIAEIDYYNGFNREAGIKIVEEACLVACNALEKMAGIERALERLEEKETELRKARHNLSFEMYTSLKAYEKAKVLTQKEITLHEAIEIIKEEVI